ncbi:MAG: PcfB family protein [Lachnospiraceae bacterium]|jgi:hypothetical protein
MNTSGEAADQVVRMTLNGVEVAAKLSGAAAKQVAVMLYAILKDQKRTKGKMRLSNMLRSGKEMKVFAVKDTDLQKFCTEAKKYGVLYCVLRDKDASDGLTDIMVRAEDASKINRIFERFKLATVDMAAVKTEIEQTKAKGADIPTPERNMPGKDKDEQFLDELMAPAPNPNKEVPHTENPTEGRNAKSRQSEPTSKPKEKAARGTSDTQDRPSVRQELRDISAQQKKKAEVSREEPAKDKPRQQKPAQHKEPKKKPKNKSTKER